MSKETLKSIRLWIDKLCQISIGVMSGQKIDNNEMITMKHKMVKQLIVLSSPLLSKDRNKIEEIYNKIKSLESDVVLWENNKGFFAKSKNAESLIQEVDEKIDQAKENIVLLKEKIKMIDQTNLEV